MQQAKHFDTLLRETVNLPQWRLNQLGERVNSIYSALRGDAVLGSLITGKTKQGSWAHRMIIKPQPDLEYDADVLLHMDENPDWVYDKGEYIEELYRALGRVGYENRSRKTRCVRVFYANDCHVDLVPFVTTTFGSKIVNRQTGQWEDSNPEGFSDWMAQRDEITNGNFRRVVRLLKYLRDYRGSFTGTRSIILTTLLGERASIVTALGEPAAYDNVPHTMVTLVEALDAWMQPQVLMPQVVDPSSTSTTFNHRWSQESYAYFRDRIHAHAKEMRAALDEPDADESTKKWRALFGDGFRHASTSSASTSPLSGAGVAAASSGRSGRAG